MIQLTSFRFGLYCGAVQPTTNHRTARIWVIKTLLGQGNRPFLEQGGLAFRCSVVLLVSSTPSVDTKRRQEQRRTGIIGYLASRKSNGRWAVQNSGIGAVRNASKRVSITTHSVPHQLLRWLPRNLGWILCSSASKYFPSGKCLMRTFCSFIQMGRTIG